MTTATDFLGYPYDDDHPSFVIMPHPPHPLDEGGEPKLAYHRPTARLYDWPAILEQAESKGYVWPDGESGRDDEWMRANTEFDIPYEFTLSWWPTTTTYNDTYVILQLTGGPATQRQKVTMDTMYVDGKALTYPSLASSVSEVWIEIGETAANVAAKLAKLATASWPKVAQSTPPKPGEKYLGLTAQSNPTRLRIQGVNAVTPQAWYAQYPVGPARMTSNPYFRGVNMAADAGVPQHPRNAGVRSEWTDDTHTGVRFIPYGFPVGGTRQMTLDSTGYGFVRDGTPLAGYLTSYGIRPDMTNEELLSAISGAFPSSPATDVTAEMPKTGYGAVFTLKQISTDAYLPFNYLPQWYLH
jgi:hypothetical protein